MNVSKSSFSGLSNIDMSYIYIYYPLVRTNSLPWKDPPIFKFGKPSISMGHDYVSHNQRVINHPAFTDPCDGSIPPIGSPDPGLAGATLKALLKGSRGWKVLKPRNFSYERGGWTCMYIIYVYVYIYIFIYIYLYMYNIYIYYACMFVCVLSFILSLQ